MSSLAADKKGVEYRWKGTRGPNGVKSGRGCLTPGEIYTFGGKTQFIQVDDGKFGERELAASQAFLECIQSATTPPCHSKHAFYSFKAFSIIVQRNYGCC